MDPSWILPKTFLDPTPNFTFLGQLEDTLTAGWLGVAWQAGWVGGVGAGGFEAGEVGAGGVGESIFSSFHLV